MWEDRRAGPAKALVDDYAGRIRKMGPGLGFQSFELREVPESKASSRSVRMNQEGQAILDALGGLRPVVLDETGSDMSSAELARWIGDQLSVCFGLLWLAGCCHLFFLFCLVVFDNRIARAVKRRGPAPGLYTVRRVRDARFFTTDSSFIQGL